MARNRHKEEHENLERWLLTYADLITLLLGLFVILYSMSQVDAARFKQFSEALKGVFHGGAGVLVGQRASIVPPRLRPSLPASESDSLRKLGEEIERALAEAGLPGMAQTAVVERGLIVRFAGNVLFDSGRAELRADACKALTALARVLRDVGRDLRVEGHTDNVPISNWRFSSNWELSTARATSVLRYLVEREQFAPSRISALGYGEFRPVVDNGTPQGRQDNRRVDLVILRAEEQGKEPGGDER